MWASTRQRQAGSRWPANANIACPVGTGAPGHRTVIPRICHLADAISGRQASGFPADNQQTSGVHTEPGRSPRGSRRTARRQPVTGHPLPRAHAIATGRRRPRPHGGNLPGENSDRWYVQSRPDSVRRWVHRSTVEGSARRNRRGGCQHRLLPGSTIGSPAGHCDRLVPFPLRGAGARPFPGPSGQHHPGRQGSGRQSGSRPNSHTAYINKSPKLSRRCFFGQYQVTYCEYIVIQLCADGYRDPH